MNETELFIKYLLSGDPLDFDEWKKLYEVKSNGQIR